MYLPLRGRTKRQLSVHVLGTCGTDAIHEADNAVDEPLIAMSLMRRWIVAGTSQILVMLNYPLTSLSIKDS